MVGLDFEVGPKSIVGFVPTPATVAVAKPRRLEVTDALRGRNAGDVSLAGGDGDVDEDLGGEAVALLDDAVEETLPDTSLSARVGKISGSR